MAGVSHVCTIQVPNTPFEDNGLLLPGMGTGLTDDHLLAVRVTEFASKGRDWLSYLYCRRNCSKCMPQPRNDMSDEDRAAVYAETYHVLEPLIRQLQDLLSFCQETASALALELGTLSSDPLSVSDRLLDALVSALDVLMGIDTLKDTKSSLVNDFSSFRRAASKYPSNEWDEVSLTGLFQFMTRRHAVMHQLATFCVSNINSNTSVISLLASLLTRCASKVQGGMVADHQKEYLYHRFIPTCVTLMDRCHLVRHSLSQGNTELSIGQESIAAADAVYRNRSKLLTSDQLKSVTDAMLARPITPLLLDIHISAVTILESSHYPVPPVLLAGVTPKGLAKTYLLRNTVPALVTAYEACTGDMQHTVELMGLTPGSSSDREAGVEASRLPTDSDCFRVLLTCVSLLQRVRRDIGYQAAFKFAFPLDTETALKRKALHSKGAAGSDVVSEFERAVRFNYSKADRTATLKAIYMLQELRVLIGRALPSLYAPACAHAQSMLQRFLRVDVAECVRSSQKHGRDDALLTCVRDVCAMSGDLPLRVPPMPRDSDSETDIPTKVAPPMASQIHAARTLVARVLASKSKRGLLTSYTISDKKKRQGLEQFLDTDSVTISTVTDAVSLCDPRNVCVGGLWFRELYLEIERGRQYPQFALSLSLPWVLTHHALSAYGKGASVDKGQKGREKGKDTDPAGLLSMACVALGLYSEAAQVALGTLRCRHLYDEIESEADLAVAQLVYTLADRLVLLAKRHVTGDTAAVDPELSGILSLIRTHTNLNVLGRCLDLGALVSVHVARLLYRSVFTARERFQLGPVSAILELQRTLHMLGGAHALLCQNGFETLLPPFPSLLRALGPSSAGQTDGVRDTLIAAVNSQVSSGGYTFHLDSLCLRETPVQTAYNATLWLEHDGYSTADIYSHRTVAARCLAGLDNPEAREGITYRHVGACLDVLGVGAVYYATAALESRLETLSGQLLSEASALHASLGDRLHGIPSAINLHKTRDAVMERVVPALEALPSRHRQVGSVSSLLARVGACLGYLHLVDTTAGAHAAETGTPLQSLSLVQAVLGRLSRTHTVQAETDESAPPLAALFSLLVYTWCLQDPSPELDSALLGCAGIAAAFLPPGDPALWDLVSLSLSLPSASNATEAERETASALHTRMQTVCARLDACQVLCGTCHTTQTQGECELPSEDVLGSLFS
ncbi:cytoplasmic FMR1-interacting protein [Kipferlia bialata]|uniref:Cytoplasmic FMR1-interacting protein n=1 Tax=Kipferlia bialata TaxID=797122 RepID=A0A9K3CNQ0_9EUKA|nr:cytoplasmic FMR1-interacting protein [Kipferlia bialata]|eukprot:g110.t1